MNISRWTWLLVSLLLITAPAVGQEVDGAAAVEQAEAALEGAEDAVEDAQATDDPEAEAAALEEAGEGIDDAQAELQAAADDAGKVAEALKEGDFSAVADAGYNWLITYGPTLLGKLIGALAILIIGAIIARMISGFVRKALRRAKLDETLSGFLAKLVRWALLVLVVIMALGVFGVPVTGFATIIAAAGFAIGLALSGLLGGFAAGVMLMIFRPFQAGDVVNAAGQTGKVDEIDLFTTTLITPDNRKIIVPNGEIYGGTIENMTTLPTRRVDVAVGASYDADIDQTKRVLLEAVAATPDVLSDPAPVIYLNELGSSSVDYAVRAWARTGDYWAVKENLTRNIKYKLDAASIGIPYPQMDVHVNQKLGH